VPNVYGADRVEFYQLTGVFGSGRYKAARDQTNFNKLDLVWLHNTAHAALEILGGYETGPPDATGSEDRNSRFGTSTFLGVVGYIDCPLARLVVGTARLVFFDDQQGERTATARRRRTRRSR
jgi:hypothetical protein